MDPVPSPPSLGEPQHSIQGPSCVCSLRDQQVWWVNWTLYPVRLSHTLMTLAQCNAGSYPIAKHQATSHLCCLHSSGNLSNLPSQTLSIPIILLVQEGAGIEMYHMGIMTHMPKVLHGCNRYMCNRPFFAQLFSPLSSPSDVCQNSLNMF